MAKISSNRSYALPVKDDPNTSSADLDTLRRIIIGPESAKIRRLQERIDNAGVKADAVSRVLPEAIHRSSAKDQKLARSLRPTIEAAIRGSVQKNPKVLADAIFPLMGPGIRKAIQATLMGMIQSFNQLLNHSFSIQGLKWRLEALRTRKPYAEIVLLHTLIYQVEQVFLIHRQNGLVLQHVVAPAVKVQDPDLVSGMLTAIEDFVHDSFNVASDQSLDTLRMGSDRSVWIEQGPKAMLAVVIRGTPPLELRHRMADILNDIHLTCSQPLDDYKGDNAVFELVRDDLRGCLDTEFQPADKKTSTVLWVTGMILLVAIAFGALSSLIQHRRTQRFLTALSKQPGIVLTETEKHQGKLVILGLKDPLAEDPAALQRVHDLPSDRVAYRWRPYVSLEPELVLKRARRALQPPPTVTLSLDGDILVAGGKAGHRWIQRFHAVGALLAGIRHTRVDDLVDTDLDTLREIRQRIETSRIYFDIGSSAVSADQAPRLTAISRDIHALEILSKQMDRPLGLRIVGHTDGWGSETNNLALSRERAEAVHRFLIDSGKVNIAMMAVGMGSAQPETGASDERIRAQSRFVGFALVDTTVF